MDCSLTKKRVRPHGLLKRPVRDRSGSVNLSVSSLRPHASAQVRLRLPVLAMLLALLGMVALTTWHDALAHVHDADHVAVIDLDGHVHDSRSDGQQDTDDPVHMAAHAATQSIVVPPQPVTPVAVALIAPLWASPPAVSGRSLAPPSILRPPRG